MSISARYHELVTLLPHFFHLHPFGWKGPRDILQSERFELPGQFPAVLLLRGLVLETDPGEPLSRQEMERRLFNPYATIHTFFDHVPCLLEGGYLSHTEGRYLVTPAGRALIERIEQTEHDYVATLTPLPLAERNFRDGIYNFIVKQ